MNDILLNSDFDMATAGGDFAVGESKAQNLALLLKANPGEFRQWPTMGIGLVNHINSSDLSGLKNDFESQANQIEGMDATLNIGSDGSVSVVV
jgi:hypothetical protein